MFDGWFAGVIWFMNVTVFEIYVANVKDAGTSQKAQDEAEVVAFYALLNP